MSTITTPVPGQPALPWWRRAAWQIFEAADSGWSLIVYSTYFGIFVQDVLHKGATSFGWAATTGALLIALCSPLLGAMTDISGRRQPYLRFFVGGTVLLTVLIGLSNSYAVAVACFALSYVFVNGAFNFWTSMLPAVSTEQNVSGIVSGAVCISYLSNIVLYGAMSAIPESKIRLVFFVIAVVYLIYALPAMTIAPDFLERSKKKLDVVGAYTRIAETLREARKHKPLFTFIIADFFFENAVASVIALMVVYARNAVGFATSELIWLLGPALLIAGLSALAFGKLVKRIGPKKVVVIDLVIWLILIASVVLLNNKLAFMIFVGPLAGIGLAGVWSSSRVMLTALTPVDRAGEIWGLFNLSGRTASVVGDATWSLVLTVVGETLVGYKAAVGSLALFIIIGMVLMIWVPNVRPTADNVVQH